jgi:biotin carboxylase
VTTILILGAGVMQEPAVRIARRKGWRVILADGNPQAPARALADQFECIDLKDLDGLLAFARSTREGSGLDGVFTAGTDFSSSVAWIAEKLGLPGIPYATAMKATDKCLMREAFAAAGVPSPPFSSWSGAGDPAGVLVRGMSFPLVVKPVDNMGARGVKRVDSSLELAEACHAALPLSRSSRVIIEEFMEGPEFSLDAIVHKGAVTVCGVADRLIRFPPSFVEMGHTMPTNVGSEAVRAIEGVFVAGIRALGIDNGAAKGDIKLTEKGPMVGEIAARLSGGYMSGWTFPLASGVEVTEAALNVAVGLPPGDLLPRFHKVCAERALISVPGIVQDVGGADEARKVSGVEEIFLRVAPGDTVVFPSNNVQKCGNVLAVAEDRGGAEASASRALGKLHIRLRPLVAATTAHLFRADSHDCFESLPPELRRSIGAMPVFRGEASFPDGESPIVIEAVPGWARCRSRDWHGIEFADSVRLACARGSGSILPEGRTPTGSGTPSEGGRDVFRLCSIFWKAVVRGGHQGGVYVLDSIRAAARRGTLKEFLSGS